MDGQRPPEAWVRAAAERLDPSLPRRGPGRPPGSKNKPKPGTAPAAITPEIVGPEQPPPAKDAPPKRPLPPLPPIVSDFISEIPYKIARGASEEWILNKGLPENQRTKLPDPDEKTMRAIHEAFAAWLKELEIEAGPTAQLILVNVAACGSIAMQAGLKRAVINAEVRRTKKSTEPAKMAEKS